MRKKPLKIVSIVGARPQFIKVKPIIEACKNRGSLNHVLIHTGQHYDYRMSKIFFKELDIPRPHYHLGVGSGSHGFQTAEILKLSEKVLIKEKPDWVLVYGDTNSTLAGALAAAKLHIPIAHIESGLRSFNRKMPEEINRVLVDHLSTLLFCPTVTAVNNLQNEGFKNIVMHGALIKNRKKFSSVCRTKGPIVANVGDVMFDVLRMNIKKAQSKSRVLARLNLSPQKYYLATIHRAENTDVPERLKKITEIFADLGRKNNLVFPMHPRTRKLLSNFKSSDGFRIIEPVSYFDMLILEKNAITILTDSGGVQKEAYWLKVPCITLRQETEWTETVEAGWNSVVGLNKDRIRQQIEKTVNRRRYFPELYGNGKAAHMIIELFFRYAGFS